MMTQEEYDAKRAAKYARFCELAEKAEKESSATWKQASLMASVIPFGQPILVGHYSEGRDRNYRARIESKHRKGYELHQKAEYYASRAEATQDNHAIMSDDPSAVDQLTQKIADLEAEQSEMKRINAALRKGANFDTLEMSEAHRKELLVIERVQAYYQPLKKGFPPYALTNLSAKIRTAKERAARVEKMQAAEDKTETIGDIRVEYCPSENRIRIYFPGKPDEATRTSLKRHGYRWTPSIGAWGAYYNNNAKWYIEELKKN
jgi:hypothetical protein